MASKNVLADVHSKIYFARPHIVLKLAANGQKPCIITPYYLVLQKSLFKRVSLFVCSIVFLQHLQQSRVDIILVVLASHILISSYININVIKQLGCRSCENKCQIANKIYYNLNIMSTDFDEISLSIIEQQKRIQENQAQRNKKFNECLSTYLDHLKEETHRLDSTEQQNDARNQMISSAFENVYERIMTSSQVALRKVKETCFEKKQFWNKLIQNNADLTDLQLKKQFYAQKRQAQDRYVDAIQSQKNKKIPYHLLLGKLKKNHNLKQWQANNKKLQQQVVKGTKTLKQWNMQDNKKTRPNYYGETNANDSQYFINQFATQPQTQKWNRAPLQRSRYNDYEQNISILKNFEYRKP